MKPFLLLFFTLLALFSNSQERTEAEETDYKKYKELYMIAQSQENDVIDKIIDYDNNTKTKLGKGNANLLYGYYFTNKNLIQADSCFRLAREIFSEIKNEKSLVSANISIAIVGQMRGNYEIALNSYFDALEIDYIKNDSIRSAKIYNNIGTVFYYLKNYKKSKLYYEKALNAFKIHDKKRLQSIVLCKLAEIYSFDGNETKSKAFFDEAHHLYIILNDTVGQLDVYARRGNVLISNTKYKEALVLYKNGFKLIKNNKNYENSYSLASINSGLGKCYYHLNEFKKAKTYYDEALLFYNTGDFYEAQLSIYSNLSEIEKELTNYKQAFEYQSIYHVQKDSMYRVEKLAIIETVEAKYDNEKKQKEIIEQENIILLKNKDIESQKSKNRLYIIVLISVVTILLLMTYFYKKQNIINTKLTELNQFKSQVFKVLGHDLRAPISNIASTSKVESTIVKAQNSLSILDELLIWGNTTLTINEKINAGKLFHEIEDEINDEMTKKGLAITIKSKVTSEINTNKDELIIILRNLVTNAVKYSEVNSVINVEIDNTKISIINIIDKSQKSGSQKGLEIVNYLAKKNNYTFETKITDTFEASLYLS